jgi:hypothetical protein
MEAVEICRESALSGLREAQEQAGNARGLAAFGKTGKRVPTTPRSRLRNA